MKPFFSVFAVFCLVASLSLGPVARADSVVNVDAARMAQIAKLVFLGTLTAKKADTVKDVPVTTYTFKVKDVAKGKIEGSEFTYSQANFKGMPSYKIGQTYLVYLTDPSPSGLRSTVGLGQGQFSVIKGMAVNERNNRGLFKNMPQTEGVSKAMRAGGFSSEKDPGPVEASSLMKMVKELNVK